MEGQPRLHRRCVPAKQDVSGRSLDVQRIDARIPGDVLQHSERQSRPRAKLDPLSLFLAVGGPSDDLPGFFI
jgi:hypothetical protein